MTIKDVIKELSENKLIQDYEVSNFEIKTILENYGSESRLLQIHIFGREKNE